MEKAKVYVLRNFCGNDLVVSTDRKAFGRYTFDDTYEIGVIEAPVINGIPVVFRFLQKNVEEEIMFIERDAYGCWEAPLPPCQIFCENMNTLKDLVVASIGRRPRKDEIKMVFVK